MNITYPGVAFLKTEHIKIISRNCKACFKCVDACPNEVIGIVDVAYFQHSHINNPDNCSGCLECLKICPNSAIILN